MSEQNKALVARFTDELWNRKNWAITDELLREDVVLHLLGKTFNGREEWRREMGAFRDGFPDMVFTRNFLVAEGDKVVVHFTATGTQTGEFQGIRPTGREVTMSGVGIFRISGGKIVEMWSHPDAASLIRQLGAVPSLVAAD